MKNLGVTVLTKVPILAEHRYKTSYLRSTTPKTPQKLVRSSRVTVPIATV
jgi:hypothetical protein